MIDKERTRWIAMCLPGLKRRDRLNVLAAMKAEAESWRPFLDKKRFALLEGIHEPSQADFDHAAMNVLRENLKSEPQITTSLTHEGLEFSYGRLRDGLDAGHGTQWLGHSKDPTAAIIKGEEKRAREKERNGRRTAREDRLKEQK